MSDLPKTSNEQESSGQEFPESVNTPHTICVPFPARFEQGVLKPAEVYPANGLKDSLSDLSLEDSNESKGKTEFIPEGTLLGRYRIGSILGHGGFGAVYLAEDEELHRTVAIKVLYGDRSASREKSKARYLKEARLLAGLDHPHIVPIYDVGDIDKGTPYIVSKFIPGCTLGERIRRSRLSILESADLIAKMAQALAYAHDHQVVHRDIKPGNIVLENGEKPYLIDFGLAERKSNIAHVNGLSGTPSYMSPEQATGENHLVDGRSDIYSLGVVFYELLLGEVPHDADGLIQLFLNISKIPPRPPRELDRSIPEELERIVMKCLSKKASDRYATAWELADDLRHWLAPDPDSQAKPFTGAKIIPKGLRSFDTSDSEFYLSLLPGPHDRNGQPEGIRFWKNRLEESDPSKTFRVGVIYGPSGCGKSSFVKAALLPRLVSRLRVVYVEATGDETEGRILRGLERACPDLPKCGRLRDAINHLRRLGDSRRKVVIFIDHFEQWLHVKRNDENSELECALRQCDGKHVQCVVLVRDDFWLALNRFMRKLEIKLVEGQNAALIDLFDPPHARHVLLAFGRAYGALPTDTPLTSDQEQFLTQSVSGLAQDGKVISVRLSLFAEMMKGRPWTPAILSEVGGAEGIGATFLEETFSSRSARPEHRRQQERARSVLRTLLPGTGTDIKGHMRSQAELQTAAGLLGRPKEFEELLGIIDGELRLITPTDTVGIDGANSSVRYYQLTHDFLVPSLRDWLTRKQKETPRGRAELLLQDRADVWNARRENRQLPTLFQWIRIRRMIAKKKWTVPQARMMAQAGRYHGLQLSIFAVFVFLATATIFTVRNHNIELRNNARAAALVDTLLASETSRAPEVIREMEGYRKWALPLLQVRAANAVEDSPAKLHSSLARLGSDPGESEYLFARMLKANPTELIVIREALMPHREKLTERLWDLAGDSNRDAEERLRAAAALSKYSPGDLRWQEISEQIASELIGQKPYEQLPWGKTIEEAGKWLLPPLADALVDERRSVPERGLIANLYRIYAKLEPEGDARLERIMYQSPDPKADVKTSYATQKRQASAAIAMLLTGQAEKVWPLLRHAPDPTVRTLLIDRMAPAGVGTNILLARLNHEPEVSARRALIQALGENGLDRLTTLERNKLAPRLKNLYCNDPDAGIHGSAAYLLRKWGMGKDVLEIDRELQNSNPDTGRNWYVNGQGHTMVKITKPAIFWMGENFQLHRRRIERSYAISSTEVTVEQFQRFLKERPVKNFSFVEAISPTPNCPMNSVSWYHAAAYCNWLSEKEGLPKEQWCYVPNKDGEYAAGMGMNKDFVNLTGYRLPTDAEWENACRSGSDTGYTYGEPAELLGNYAWYDISTKTMNSNPVACLRPNDNGLFDMHSNIWEWCQDLKLNHPISWKGHSFAENQFGQATIVQAREGRVSRGGAFNLSAGYARSAFRFGFPPENISAFQGFRPARTIAP